MKRIVIPVDGSEAALHAVRTAVEAVVERSVLPDAHLVTVQAPILSGNVTRFFTAEMIESYYQEEGDQALASTRQVLDEAGVEYQARVIVGPLAQTIIGYAEDENCDHIVMGTRGLGSVTSMVLGSVTSKVLSLTPVPVTLVP